jgi:single-strand DNA-binding protein
MNLNKVIIVGRAGKEPELRTTQSGQPVTQFSLATSQVYTDKSGKKQETTEWHSVVLWGRLAEIAAQYVVKGSLLLIEGRLQTRQWEDKKGSAHYSTEIVGERLQLGPKPQNAQVKSEKVDKVDVETGQFDFPDDEEIKPEDLPF